MKKTNHRKHLTLPIAVISTLFTCFGLISILTQSIINGKVGEQRANWMIIAIILIAAAVGSFINRIDRSKSTVKRDLILLTVILGLQFTMSLMIDGTYTQVIARITAVIAGWGSACAISTKLLRKKRAVKRRN